MSHNLPSGYTEVEYIKSTGTQHIDTGIIPIATDDVSVDIYDFQTFQLTGKNLLGLSYAGEWSASKGWYVGIAGGSGKNAWNCHPTNTPDPTYANLDITTGQRYKLSINGNGYYVDDVQKVTLNTYSHTIGTGKSLWLFAVNFSSTTYNDGSWAFGVTDIKVNGALVRSLIPCINPQSEVGMYDLVSNTFFGNSGTGAFIAGHAVECHAVKSALLRRRGMFSKVFTYEDLKCIRSSSSNAQSISIPVSVSTSNWKVDTYITSEAYKNGKCPILFSQSFKIQMESSRNFFFYYYNASNSWSKYGNYFEIEQDVKYAFSYNRYTRNVTYRYSYTAPVPYKAGADGMTLFGGGAFTIYPLTIKDTSNNLLYNLVPKLRSDGVAGFYDTLTDEFYPQEGPGSFGYTKEDGTVVYPV